MNHWICEARRRSAGSLPALGLPHGQAARATLAIVTLLLVLAASAFAADDNTIIVPGASRAAEPVATSAAGGLNSLSLVFGLGLAGVGGWLIWRNRRGTPAGRDGRALAIDETRSLGNRQFLVVASYEGKKFLIGVCPGRIDMLAPLDGSAPGGGKSRE